MSRTGGCLCGAVRYEISAVVTETGACHCGMCRKWSGGVYLGVEVPPHGLQVTGADHLKSYKSSPWAERIFCGTCGSSMWYRVSAPGPHQGTYHLGFGTLDDTSDMKMSGEIFIDKKPAAYAFAGDGQKMTEAEFMKLFGAG